MSRLPQDFLWGVSTAAFQIEGATAAGGRGPSIWDTFTAQPGHIRDGDTAEVACDHYSRWREDVALLPGLGVNTYRFSVAWPRVMPTGRGPVNEAGLDFYDRLVDEVLAAGIRPMVTLYHWDLPQALQDAGGWAERSTAGALADFAAVVAGRLGDRVRDWITVSEPMCVAWQGHLTGDMAPGERDLGRALRAGHHVLLGHGLAAQAVRATAGETPAVGLHHFLSPVHPASERPEDVAAARRADGHYNRWWLDPAAGRGYPQDMIEVYGAEPPVRDGDPEVIATPIDFLGVAYYFRRVVADDPGGSVPHVREITGDAGGRTAMGWEVYPEGLTELLTRLRTDYRPPRIIVAENGSAFDDVPGPDGTVADPERAAFLEAHVAACVRAREQGVPVEGYFAWSMLDNFEWGEGYSKRFGLVHVDFATQRRTVKESGHRYARLIRGHQEQP